MSKLCSQKLLRIKTRRIHFRIKYKFITIFKIIIIISLPATWLPGVSTPEERAATRLDTIIASHAVTDAGNYVGGNLAAPLNTKLI